MDLMSIRRELMMANNSVWKMKTVTVPTTITNNASAVAVWLQTLMPESNYAVFVRDNESTDGAADATLCVATRFGGNLFNYIRFYGGNRQAQANWSSAFYLTVTSGDKYTVFFQ